MLRLVCVAAVLSIFATGCGEAPEEAPTPVAEEASPIVGGSTDSGDAAVVLVYNQVKGYLCSGTVIAPNVVLTAGHCTKPDSHGSHYVIAGGTHPLQGAAWTRSASAVHTNPAYGIHSFGVGDTGVLLLGSPAPVTPMAWLHTRTSSVYAPGTSFKAVGYGITGMSSSTDTAGTRRKVTLTITQRSASNFSYGGPTKNTCEGDSGGPAIKTIAGVTTLIGTVSYGDSQCSQYGVDMRVDEEAAFIRQYAP